MTKLTPAYIKNILKYDCNVQADTKLLLTVSGGMDSMVMLDVIINSGYYCDVAHCNFNLRSTESDGDEQFVRDVCKKYGVRLHVRSFYTKEYASEKGISIEMAARELRYGWFHSLLKENKLDVMVTAHHGDDAIETFFLNLIRGTGIKGLSGMKKVNGKVIRPFLGLSRSEIERYCREQDIEYRHDSSNDEVKYLRNKVRHEIIPRFREMKPAFFSTMSANMKRVSEAQEILEKRVEDFRADCVVEEHGRVLIPISKISEHPQKGSLLFELLRPYGFNPDVVNDIIKSFDSIPGKQFYSQTHRLIRDRFNLILFGKKDVDEGTLFINSEKKRIEKPVKLELRIFSKPEDYSFSRDLSVAHFDADNVEFPLLLRKWKRGDVFRPLGMKGFKKVSDFFTDNKLSIADKEDAFILQSGDDIIWIVNMRMDDRYKITNRTKTILEIKTVR